MKHTDIIQKLNLEQKCALLSGETVFTTRALPGFYRPHDQRKNYSD